MNGTDERAHRARRRIGVAVSNLGFLVVRLGSDITNSLNPLRRREYDCYECGRSVRRSKGERHGRAGWVHFDCILDGSWLSVSGGSEEVVK